MKYFPLLLTCCFLLLLSSACRKAGQDCHFDKNCSDYVSQADAQVAFSLDPECRGDLDADNDGRACEDWADYYQNAGNGGGGSSGGNSGCPTTSACGCSGHNMDPCNADPCCKWTTGEGCGCS